MAGPLFSAHGNIPHQFDSVLIRKRRLGWFVLIGTNSDHYKAEKLVHRQC